VPRRSGVPKVGRSRKTGGHRRGPEGPAVPGMVVLHRGQADSDSSRLAMADLRFAAWFLWITPLLAALSS
jgi:hypothetical protein